MRSWRTLALPCCLRAHWKTLKGARRVMKRVMKLRGSQGSTQGKERGRGHTVRQRQVTQAAAVRV
jgi:hypothetical protein